MIPQRDDDSDPLQVWKRSLPDDEQDIEEMSTNEAIGAAATLVIICSVIITVVVGAVIGGVILFLKYKNQIGL